MNDNIFPLSTCIFNHLKRISAESSRHASSRNDTHSFKTVGQLCQTTDVNGNVSERQILNELLILAVNQHLKIKTMKTASINT
jgi:hypothetical protein